MNSNATRFSQILSLDFDQAGQVASASIQVRGHSGYQEIGYLISCLKNQALSYASFFWDSAPSKMGPGTGRAGVSARAFTIPLPMPPALGGAWFSFFPNPAQALALCSGASVRQGSPGEDWLISRVRPHQV